MAAGEESDGEWEEDEQDVVVELSGMTNSDFLKSSNNCKILGLDTEQPILQIGGLFFTGEYQDAMGTCVIFKEKEPSAGAEQPGLRYYCHTRKKLVMNRTFLSEKQPDNASCRVLDVDSIREFSAAGCSVGYHARADNTGKSTHLASSQSSSGSGLEDDEVTNR
uniref:general transcription factor 3C polypeptide 6 isoform X2 n=1 Tax=Myxine glutinosa TaxID=7769 RepID=UPI00358E9068